MNNHDAASAPPGNDAASAPPMRPIESRAQFAAAVHEVLDQALTRRSRRMLWVDADFAEWPLDDPALLQRLTAWVQLPQRQLVLLAVRYDELGRRCARFVAWYRMWAHVASAFSPAVDDVADLPCALLADGAALVHLLDAQRWRGWATSDVSLQRLWRDRLDAVLQRSEQAFPATTLGL